MEAATLRATAAEMARRLQAAGHVSYFAGGCVRDELLGREPHDYDIATDATPPEVLLLFPRAQYVGAHFGVVVVHEGGEMFEIATFRTDGSYRDGRRPESVTFATPQEDAQRRDFTINGLFLDPLTGEVHDYVGGREDLKAGVVRAIGVPAMRFGEDHLRMLRAVRFAAGFGFALDGETRMAIEKMTHLVTTVSPERIAAELRAMVSRTGRRRALELLDETGLAREVLPEVAPAAGDTTGQGEWWQAATIIDALDEPDLSTALAAVFESAGEKLLRQAAARLRLSNREIKLACWLVEAVAAVGHTAGAEELARRKWSEVQPWLAHDDAFLLADLLRARADCGRGSAEAAVWVTAQLERPKDELDPPPLLTGSDLLAAGVPAGRAMGEMLARLRSRQLDGEIATREAALEWVRGRE